MRRARALWERVLEHAAQAVMRLAATVSESASAPVTKRGEELMGRARVVAQTWGICARRLEAWDVLGGVLQDLEAHVGEVDSLEERRVLSSTGAHYLRCQAAAAALLLRATAQASARGEA